MRRHNTIVAGFGRKGSGKSQFLFDRWVRAAPRVLTIEGTKPEAKERDPANVIEVVGWAQLCHALERAADYDAWHIAAVIEVEDVRELASRLTPPIGSTGSLCDVWGGLALTTGEVDQFAPNAGASPEVLSLFRRGRHYGLDLYVATQRPASCAVDVRSMADIIFAFQQGSDRELDAVAAAISEDAADRASILPQYHCIYFDRDAGTCVELDAQRRVVASVNALSERARRVSGTGSVA